MRHEAIDVRMMGAIHETIDAPEARRETRDIRRVSSLSSCTPVSRLTSHATAPWPKVKLGKIGRVAMCKRVLNRETADTGEIPFFKIGTFGKKANAFITRDKFEYYRTHYSYPQKGNVLISAAGTIGRLVVFNGEPAYFQDSNIVWLEHDGQRLCDKYLYYFLLGHEWQFTQGATIQRLYNDDIRSTEIPLPPLPVQRRIADILSAYDDLIENNRRRIAILEETARLTYRKWFGGAKKSDWGMRRETIDDQGLGVRHETIDDPHVLSLASKAPRVTRLTSHAQSRVATLGKICREVRRGVSPDAIAPDTPYIGLEHMPRRSISLCEWESAQKVTSTKLAFEAGDILFGKIRPYFHKVGITFVDGVASSDAIVIKPLRPELHAYVLMTVSSDAFVAAASQGMKEGSKMPRADWKQLLNYSVAMPDDDTLAEFNKVLNPILEQLKTLCFSIRNLAAARDMLLPRLMKGEMV